MGEVGIGSKKKKRIGMTPIRKKNNSDGFSLCSFSIVKCAVWWGFLRGSTNSQAKARGLRGRFHGAEAGQTGHSWNMRPWASWPNPCQQKSLYMRQRWHHPLRKSLSTNLMIKTKKCLKAASKTNSRQFKHTGGAGPATFQRKQEAHKYLINYGAS